MEQADKFISDGATIDIKNDLCALVSEIAQPQPKPVEVVALPLLSSGSELEEKCIQAPLTVAEISRPTDTETYI